MPNRDYVTIVATLTDAPPGKSGQFLVTQDTGNKYEWTGEWTEVAVGGAMTVVDGQTRHIAVNTFVELESGISTTTTADVVAGDTVVPVTDPTGFLVGDYIRSQITTAVKYPQITIINANDLTVDRPLDIGGPAGSDLFKVFVNMNVLGSLAAPVIFRVIPSQTSGIFPNLWNITAYNLSMIHGTAGDLGLFGNLPALTNGVALRTKIGGVTRTLSNWKTNGDIKNDVYNLEFDSRSGGQGVFGTSAYGTLGDLGVTIKLDGDADDEIEILIQDDLTGLGSFQIKVQGNAENA